MAYIPFRDEETEFRPDDHDYITDLYMKHKERIRKVKSKLMEYLEDVEESRQYVEDTTKKLNLKEVGVRLEAAAEH